MKQESQDAVSRCNLRLTQGVKRFPSVGATLAVEAEPALCSIACLMPSSTLNYPSLQRADSQKLLRFLWSVFRLPQSAA